MLISWASRQSSLGSLVAASAAAYSTRRLTNRHAGSAIRVRRSTDNVEADIGFTASGDLNESALTTFIGANSAFVTTVYDQSGNGRNLVQAVAANQPRIVNAGVIDRISTRAAYRTDGVSQVLATSSFVIPQPLTRSSVLQFLNPALAGQPLYLDTAATGAAGLGLYNATVNNLAINASTDVVIKTGQAANDKATIIEIYNGASSSGSYNGSQTSGAAGANGMDGLIIGNARGGVGAHFATAIYGDILIFPVALATSDRLVLEANQKAYWGTP